MFVRSKWNTQPLSMDLNQEVINYMISYVTEAIGLVDRGTLELEGKPVVHLLEKEK